MPFVEANICGLKNLSPNWDGFLISTEKRSGCRRYVAKCPHCQAEFRGESGQLVKHRYETCPMKFSWPEGEAPRKKIRIEGQSSLDRFVEKNVSNSKDIQLLRFLCSSSIAFSVVNDPYFREYVKAMHPQPPNRNKLRDEILPLEVNRIEKLQLKRLQEASVVSIVLDGWTDVSGGSYVAVVACIKGDQEYLGNLDLEGKRHTAAAMKEGLLNLVATYTEWNKVAAVISDNAAVMRKVRREIKEEYHWINDVPCVLHMLNLVSGDCLKGEATAKLVVDLGRVSSLFRRSSVWRDVLKKWAANRATSPTIPSYTETRWFSFAELVNSLLEKKQFFRETFSRETVEGRDNRRALPQDVHNIISDPIFFDNLADLQLVFNQITGAIKSLEGDASSVAFVWPVIIKLFKSLQQSLINEDGSTRQSLIATAINSLNKRSVIISNDLFFVAFFINPNYRAMAISGSISEREMQEKIARMAIAMGKSLEETKSIIKEAKDYLNGNREYGSKIEGPLEYWNSIPPNPLTEFNLRLLSVLPHSAVVERLFSRMAYIKDKYQNRMAGSTLQSLTKLKLELKKDKNRKETGIVGVGAVPSDNETEEGGEDEEIYVPYETIIDEIDDLELQSNETTIDQLFDVYLKPYETVVRHMTGDKTYKYSLADVFSD